MDFTLPPSLERGDKVAVVRSGNGPAKTEFPEVYGLGIERMEEVFGLEVKEYTSCNLNSDELTANPKQRAEDIMSAFSNDEIKAVFAAIGGTGEQVRILKHLDPAVLRKNPTRFYGYSDNTSLGLYLWNQGIISFQGPMVMTEFGMHGSMHEYTSKKVDDALHRDSFGEVEASEKFTDETIEWGSGNLDQHRDMEEHPGLEWYNAGQGTVEGRIWGGCLELLEINLQIEKYIPANKDLHGEVLAIETSEEMPDPDFVDRFLMSLGERGMLEEFSAVIVGLPKAQHRERKPTKPEREEYREEQREVVKKRIDEYTDGIPIVFNMNFGHSDPILPLPIGGRIKIDTDGKNIRLPVE
jgi:muramoyltetrapeptide carboxypeptidase LdcA involved in peptidoglycan recycling